MPANKNRRSNDADTPRRETTAPGGRFAGAWPPADDAAREALVKEIQRTPLGYGTWRDLKALYKQAEASALAEPASADAAVLGVLLGRIDAAPRVPESRQAPRITFPNHKLDGVSAIAALGTDAVAVLGHSYSRGYSRRLIVMEADSPDPLKPAVRGSLEFEGYYYGNQFLHALDTRLYLAGGSYNEGTLEIIETATSTRELRVLARHTFREGSLLGFSVARAAGGGLRGAALPMSQGRRGVAHLQVLDLSDPERGGGITVLGSVQVPNAQSVVLLEGGTLAVVATGNVGFSWSSLPKPGGLRVYDLSDPARPRQIGALPLDNVNSLALGGSADRPLLFAGVSESAQSHGVQVVDLATPAAPRKLGYVALTAPVQRLYLHPERRNLLFAGPYAHGAVVDVSDPAAPRTLTQERSGLSLQISAAQGDTLWTGEGYGGMAPWYIADPAHPVQVGTPVSAATLGYMKRRARRVLRHLEEAAPDRYPELAARMLLALGRQHATLSRSDHWAAMDVVFGGGGRFVQKNHGRGAYVPASPDAAAAAPRIRLRRREERRPDLWDAHPEVAASLVSAKETPDEAREMAIRVLRANRIPLPDLTSGAQERMFKSPSPVLQVFAARQVGSALVRGRKVGGPNAADAYRLSGAGARRAQEEAIAKRASEDPAWLAHFVRHALDGLNARAAGATAALPRRDVGLMALLFRLSLDPFAPDDNAILTARALAGGDAALTEPLHARLARGTDPARVGRLLLALATIPDEAVRDAAVDATVRGLSGALKPIPDANLTLYQTDDWVRRAMWRVLAAAAPPEQLAGLWRQILAAPAPSDYVRTALSSPDALAALARSGIPTDEITASLTERPFLVELLSPETFGDVLRRTPPEVALQLIAAAPDERWSLLRPSLVRALAEGFGGAAFWVALPKALEADPADRLSARLLRDEEVAVSLLGVDDIDGILAIREPEMGDLLGRWAGRHVVTLPRDSGSLLTAATHELPQVRAVGLSRVRAVGMGMPFALALLESEVPPSVEAGRAFFEDDRTEDGDKAFPYALALCDSPRAAVRAWGREYVTARRHRVSTPALCRALFENPNPDIQAFVADLVAAPPAPDTPQTGERPDTEETARFDGEVLRARGRARRAKEKIKERQSAAPAPTVNVPTLLSLARGADGTARDAEWALSQLARLALSGQSIDGLTVETPETVQPASGV
jgi:Uncharacterized conserved protein